MLKRCLTFFLVVIFSVCIYIRTAPYALAAVEAPPINTKSAILMEPMTGTILFELKKDDRLPIASVTKVMTLLLIMEAIRDGKLKYGDNIKVSQYASSMGGSQVFLSPGEDISVNELLKCIAVASGNDASVAMAEAIAGSEEGFVSLMNNKVSELNLKNTHFMNCTGLDAAEHYSSAYDIAVLSRELMKYPKIFEYTTIWMDSIRNGKFGLSNTNRLIRFYDGATGLKTGSTVIAQNCISATAKRGDMQLISVILGSDTSDIRFENARKLLDYGFANWNTKTFSAIESLPPIKIIKGVKSSADIKCSKETSVIFTKGKENAITSRTDISTSIDAPVELGQKVGEVIYELDGQELAKIDIVTTEAVARLGYKDVLIRMINMFLLLKI